MNTTEVETKTVNFLELGKKIYDWRYEKYSLISGYAHKSEIVYWIGIIDLEHITKTNYTTQVLFVDFRHDVQTDAERARDEDGYAPGQTSVYEYNFKEIHEAMLASKKKGHKFFHVFLEEWVNNFGYHRVSILYDPKSAEDVIFGTGKKQPWIRGIVKDWLFYSSIEINDSTGRICVLSHSGYNWQK